MSWRIPELLLATGFAYCFAALGNIVLRRRAARLQDWNESFLAGLAVAGTLLFPLSLVLSRYALLSVAVLLAACGAHDLGKAVWRLGQRSAAIAAKPHSTRSMDVMTVVFIAAIAIPTVAFLWLNLRFSYGWDGFIIWATKARVLYDTGSMTTRWWFHDAPERLMLYPQLVPLYEALVALVRGAFDWSSWNSFKAVFPFFYLSLLFSSLRSARTLAPARIAYGAVALLVLLPGVFSETSVGGYADMPQAAMAAGLLAACLGPAATERSFKNPVAWLCAGLILVKSEGMILLAAFAAALGLLWLSDGRMALLQRIRSYRHPLLIVGGCVLLRWLFLETCGARDPTFGPMDRSHVIQAAGRWLQAPALCLVRMVAVKTWGLFWPAFFLGSAVLLAAGRRLERTVALATLFAMGAYVSVYYLSNWDIAVHIPNSYDRLLCHLAPSAAVTIAAAYWRLASGGRGARHVRPAAAK